jgi:hypothetical protein
MYDQTPVNRINGLNWTQHEEEQAETGRIRQLVADITELAELQARLIAGDIRLTAASMVKPLLFMVMAVVLLLGMTPVLILAVANVLVEQQQWSPSMAQFACVGAAFLVAAGLGTLAFFKLKELASPLQRSLSELEKNLDKLRQMLVGKEPIVERFERRNA